MSITSRGTRILGIPERYPLLIDGGLSNQLESQGNNLNNPLWTAALLSKHPEEIRKAHLAYLSAGAQCLITASYQATPQGFLARGFDSDTAGKLLLSTVSLAREAIEEFRSDHRTDFMPRVAASIGPYGAYLADGSEYTGSYGISAQALTDFHSPRLELLDTSDADFFAVETLPSLQEAEVLARLLENTRKRAWVSFSCKNDKQLRDGAPIASCVQLFAHHPRVFAIGVNCTAPRYISGLIKRIKGIRHDKRVVIYPNSGEIYHAKNKTWSNTADLAALERLVAEWLDLGADMIGGCCRLGPEALKTIARVIHSRQQRPGV